MFNPVELKKEGVNKLNIQRLKLILKKSLSANSKFILTGVNSKRGNFTHLSFREMGTLQADCNLTVSVHYDTFQFFFVSFKKETEILIFSLLRHVQ